MVVVVAQLAEWSLPTPEDQGLIPAISNFFKYQLITFLKMKKMGNDPFQDKYNIKTL